MCARRRDLRSIASEVGISFGAVQSILTDIVVMSKVSARLVSRLLTNDQKKDSGISCLAIKMIIAILSSELYPKMRHGSKMQSKEWKYPGSPLSKKFKRFH